MRASVRLNSWVLPLVTVALIAAQILSPAKAWEALLVALGGAWVIGYVWARSLRNGLDFERAMRFGWAQVGDALEEQFTLRNGSQLLATWVEVIDHSTLPGYRVSLATCISGRESNTWRTRGVCTRRGIYRLGGTTLRSGDPLGIYSVEIPYSENAMLLVTPPVVPLPAIEVAPGGWLGEGRTNPNAAEKVYSATQVRPYTAGDSLRLIHWRTTARLGEPYVRQLEGAPEGAWWIVLDLDGAVQVGEEPDSTTEAGVILAASLADRGLRLRKEVGLVASSKETVWMPPRSTDREARRMEILRALAGVEPGQTSLCQLLEKAGPSLGRQASLLVITPSADGSWLKPLGQLAWRGIQPTVVLLDGASFGGIHSAEPLARLLDNMNIARHIVTRDLLDQPAARPSAHGQWEWRVLPTGKAIATRLPGDMSWKKLA